MRHPSCKLTRTELPTFLLPSCRPPSLSPPVTWLRGHVSASQGRVPRRGDGLRGGARGCFLGTFVFAFLIYLVVILYDYLILHICFSTPYIKI